ncbi:helix-turn-helix transcriptional regulator [Bacillus luteolus]|uniref:Helix-turn-helix transcriptional regulator n=1 Tax=Litchfieldia luteola TaxID=682179 RepID=A0ABR9QGM2_9BACI|nr:AraC family transcriptional regulator [Cytobacillus luteolus]MBE4907637.1 helix-turn-helix transcriptional regulator [Cytobacillus luteolus]MBP1941088.1 AraC-like DNA-binding protein [Cytobacillus luteolus]
MGNTIDQEVAVAKAIEYMKENLDKDITSEELARRVGYSPFHFSRIFKEITGVSPRHFLSALRIESGKRVLVNSSSSSVLKALLTVGFKSLGTFSSKFKHFVGLSPKQFQLSTEELTDFINHFGKSQTASHLEVGKPPMLTCKLEVPVNFKGVIFVGLFPRPIPDQKPIVGTAFTQQQTSCTFSEIPPGSYFLLVTAIKISLNPRDYFLLDTALRGKYDKMIEVREDTRLELKLTLREPVPSDPPILINLPKLLLEKERNKAN